MRTVLNFNSKWAFTKLATEIPTEIDKKWCFTNLPHCWNAIDGQDGDNDYYRGKGYYAKNFAKTDLPEADRYYLEIRGANSSAEVYLNGKNIASHDGGYSTWRVDMTDSMDMMNMLVIVVDNSANDRVYPQMADFTFYGGLYRDVNIICVNDTHFDLDYYGGPGIKVTPEIIGADAKVEVETFVANLKEGQKIVYTVYDKDENVVATAESDETKVTFDIKNVHLWHGRRDPYLYCCEAEILREKSYLIMFALVLVAEALRLTLKTDLS